MLAIIELLVHSLSGLWHILELVDYVGSILDMINSIYKQFRF